jgi:hypothetical protein
VTETFPEDESASEDEPEDRGGDEQYPDESERSKNHVGNRRLVNGLLDHADDDGRRLLKHDLDLTTVAARPADRAARPATSVPT